MVDNLTLTPGQASLALATWERRQRAVKGCDQAIDALVRMLKAEHELEGDYQIKGTLDNLQLVKVDKGDPPNGE